ncbi:MAG: Cell division protein ftsA [Candidatus Moranbacteria bacterium GW2011_GWE1_49_15]|nr:MAG: Cell division protein ftsA [Candidatus Moranbacteria bacterium GW2011_GWE2_47_10]KKW07028.1 MAG: Cell division protein ftsA [Candidatus Moranbacteria bacterium GW2011_GWE1_49_15]HBP01501.1 cell division protein FtsA [Candidatus Moranbacteria bacterium]
MRSVRGNRETPDAEPKFFMSRNNIIAGIDIGSSNVRTVIAQEMRGEEALRIIGVGIVPSSGIRRGAIIDIDEAAKSVNESVGIAERMSGEEIRKAHVSIGGTEITLQDSKGVIAIGRADGEVVEDDVNRVITEAQAIPLPMNKDILHIIPKRYRLDDQNDIKNPLGMRGVRLEVEALVVESSAAHVKNLTKCLYQAGIEIEDIALEPLASSKAVLTKKQKELGVVLVNIGGGTTSIAVFEEGEILHTAILPVGAGHITNDIAIGLRTSIDVAERVKLEYGTSLTRGVNQKEEIDISKFDSQEDGTVSRYHVTEIIEARLVEIFEIVQAELKKIGKAGLLPAGAVLVGGGAKLPEIIDLAKEILRLPIQIGYPGGFTGVLDKVDDPSFATAAGLLLWGDDQANFSGGVTSGIKVLDNLSKGTGYTVGRVKDWIGKFLP